MPPTHPLSTLKARAEFLAVRAGRRRATPAFSLEALERSGGSEPAGIRYGLTATKRLGGAVVRNRARRRLRALARAVLPEKGTPGWDYVLVARSEALTRPFATMKAELESALEMLQMSARSGRDRHQGRGPKPPPQP